MVCTKLQAAVALPLLWMASAAPIQASPQADRVQYLVVNLTDPMPDHEQEMAEYFKRHGERFARYSGVLSFRLFEAAGEKGAMPTSPYRFMQVYEMDRPRAEAQPPQGIGPEEPRPPVRASVTYVFRPAR